MALSNYRPDIDGLRAVAVLAVVLHHLSIRLVPGGYIGVDVFFVISGYLITRIISREMAEGTFTFSRFYERRARRIFPALFAMLAVTLLAAYFLLLPSDYAFTLRAALGTLVFSSNVIFWHELAQGYFAATDSSLNPLLHTWSLAVEEQFYVIFPILLLVFYRYLPKHIFRILLGCALVSLGAAALLVKNEGVAVFFLSPFRAWELLAGALLTCGSVPAVRSRVLREALVAGGLLSIVIACFVYDKSTTFPGLSALVPVLGAAAIIHAGSGGPTLAGRLLQSRPVVYVGLISYSLYLWHWPVIVLARYANAMGPMRPYLPALLAVSLLLGSLSYHFIERPFRRGGRVTRGSAFTLATAFASALAVVAAVGMANDGFPSRFNATVVAFDKARNPKIPSIECDKRSTQSWCVLGISEGRPATLLWGDSHMLAWEPALRDIFVKQEQRAIFVPFSGCPPLFNVVFSIHPECELASLSIQNQLLAHPEIKTVVIAANWGPYFPEERQLAVRRDGVLVTGTAAVQQALISTIQWIRDQDRQVIVIGSVPVYEQSIPLGLALEVITGHSLLQSSVSEQRRKNAPFFKAIEAVQPGPSFRFIDPIAWLCANGCQVKEEGVSLYRDPHHLSVAGAMALEAELASGLGFSPARLPQVAP